MFAGTFRPKMGLLCTTSEEPSAVSAVFLGVFKCTTEACTVNLKLVRKRKVIVPAGRSVSHEGLVEMQLNVVGPTANEDQSQSIDDRLQPATSKEGRPSTK